LKKNYKLGVECFFSLKNIKTGPLVESFRLIFGYYGLSNGILFTFDNILSYPTFTQLLSGFRTNFIKQAVAIRGLLFIPDESIGNRK
jgi:hypothetical protein